MEPKVLVYHPMQQHSFNTALALKHSNIDFEYWTSVYYFENKFVYKMLSFFLKGKTLERMKDRRNPELDLFAHTSCTFLGLLFLLSLRLSRKGVFSSIIRKKLAIAMGKKVGKYIIKNKFNIVICYDVWSYGLIEYIKKKAEDIIILTDYSSIYFERILDIINKDISLNNNRVSYKKVLNYYSKFGSHFRSELKLSDYYLSASSFTDSSLIDYGVKKGNIFRATYGTCFSRKQFYPPQKDILTFVYVGKISYTKGSHYLLKAIQEIGSKAKFVFAGQDADGLINEYINKCDNLEYKGFLTHDKVADLYKDADVAITASLYDGFSLFLVEAASNNLPIICTENTGVCDFVHNYENGLVVKPFSIEEIKRAITFCIENRKKLEKMCLTVGDIVNELTWDSYDSQIRFCIEEICKRKGIKNGQH